METRLEEAEVCIRGEHGGSMLADSSLGELVVERGRGEGLLLGQLVWSSKAVF